MYTHYMKKPKYTYTLIYINILGPPPSVLNEYVIIHKDDSIDYVYDTDFDGIEFSFVS